jgi:D-arabinose 1-dehydrogenase-like Zn-dependent alcohol dehydrogenase
MRAVGVTEYGGPDVLELVELPRPSAGPGQIRIRVHAATVNPGDTLLRIGDLDEVLRNGPLKPPYVPGMEAAGVIDQIGPGTPTQLQVGDRVMAVLMPIDATGGAYAEYLVVDADQAARAPAGTTHADAATLPMNGLTARLALDVLNVPPEETIAVTGSAGAVGGYAIQLAKVDGLRVIADAAASDETLVAPLAPTRSSPADPMWDNASDSGGPTASLPSWTGRCKGLPWCRRSATAARSRRCVAGNCMAHRGWARTAGSRCVTCSFASTHIAATSSTSSGC